MKKIISIFLLCILLLLSGCNNVTSKPSVNNVNLENKKYFDSLIEKIKTQKTITVQKAERKIIFAEKYEMNLTLDTKNNILSGKSIIHIKNNSNDTVNSVVLRNYSVMGESSIINIDLGRSLAPGNCTQITYEYKYDIPKKKNRYGYTKYEDNKIFQLSFCFPTLAIYENGKWNENPCIEDGAEANYTTVSNYDVLINVPKDYTVIATGTETKIADGKYKICEENLREFAFVAGNNLKKSSIELNGIIINDYHYDHNGSKKYIDYSLNLAKDSLNLFSKLIGDYPYQELDIVNCFMDSAMEYPGMIMIGYPDVKELKNIDDSNPYEYIEADIPHEIGHQWFYGVVGNDPYNEPWLDEAFAEYLEDCVFPISGCEILPIIENEKDGSIGIMSVEEFYEFEKTCIEQQSFEKKINLAYNEYDRENDEYSYYVYDGGACFLFELQQQLGDVKFFSMLNNYYNNYKFSEIKTADFLAFIKLYDNSETMNQIIDKYIYQ